MNLQLSCIWLLLFRIAIARVYETDDAIVTEADSRSSRAAHNLFDLIDQVRMPAIDVQWPPSVTLEDRSCFTYDRQPGLCLSLRECYPYTRAHRNIGNHEMWIMGSRGMCNYAEPGGKQFYGICCRPKLLANRFTWDGSNKNQFIVDGSRIVNGENSYKGEYPFMVGIESNGKFLCGGSLLDSSYVLTAAHCVNRLSPAGVAKLSVFMGVADLTDPDRVTRRVHSITRHKEFDGNKLHNDVALLRLSSPVEFSNLVSPVCLHDSPDQNFDGSDAVAIGWGRLRDGGPRSETLQKVSLQIKSQEDCKSNFGNRAPGGIVDHFICASAPGKDSCGGDSGGPLMVGQCQVGIVSWGIGCATDTYGVYTRISSFQSWIARNKGRF